MHLSAATCCVSGRFFGFHYADELVDGLFLDACCSEHLSTYVEVVDACEEDVLNYSAV